MTTALVLAGRIAGILGILLCAGAGIARLTGHYTVGGYQSVTILLGGIAALACGSFLLQLAQGARTDRGA